MNEFEYTRHGEIWAYNPRGKYQTYEDKQKRSEAFERLLNALEENEPNVEIESRQLELARA